LPRTPIDVGATFDSIAEAFDATRSRPWPFVTEWLEGLEGPRGLLVDIGCGNGRHLEVATALGHAAIGTDLSRRLLELARRRAPRRAGLLLADARDLPLATGSARTALAVAVLHHIQEEEGRRRVASEVHRILSPGGEALVSVWALDRPEVAFRAVATPLEGGEAADLLVPWRAPGGPRVGRYHRVIALDQLRGLLVEGGLHVVRAWDVGANHVVHAKRR
jgi:tRNA (uracil-5-)-methyltransferase TRM9